MARTILLDAEERVRESAVLMPLDESVELLSGGTMVRRYICNNVLDRGGVLLTAVWQEKHCA
jgi:hypothetical protein